MGSVGRLFPPHFRFQLRTVSITLAISNFRWKQLSWGSNDANGIGGFSVNWFQHTGWLSLCAFTLILLSFSHVFSVSGTSSFSSYSLSPLSTDGSRVFILLEVSSYNWVLKRIICPDQPAHLNGRLFRSTGSYKRRYFCLESTASCNRWWLSEFFVFRFYSQKKHFFFKSSL